MLKDEVHFRVMIDLSRESLAEKQNKIWSAAIQNRFRLRTPIDARHTPYLYYTVKQKCFGEAEAGLTCDRSKHVHTRNIISSATNHPSLESI